MATTNKELELRAEVSRQLLCIATPFLAFVCAFAIWCGHPLMAMCFVALLGVDFVDHLMTAARVGRYASLPIAPIAALTIIVSGTAAFAAL